jgi:hypothetical protein
MAGTTDEHEPAEAVVYCPESANSVDQQGITANLAGWGMPLILECHLTSRPISLPG